MAIDPRLPPNYNIWISAIKPALPAGMFQHFCTLAMEHYSLRNLQGTTLLLLASASYTGMELERLLPMTISSFGVARMTKEASMA